MLSLHQFTSKMVPSLQGCSSVIFVGLTFHVRVDVVCVWPAAARVSESQSNQLFSCLQCLLLVVVGVLVVVVVTIGGQQMQFSALH